MPLTVYELFLPPPILLWNFDEKGRIVIFVLPLDVRIYRVSSLLLCFNVILYFLALLF